jgi:hypothetical protein
VMPHTRSAGGEMCQAFAGGTYAKPCPFLHVPVHSPLARRHLQLYDEPPRATCALPSRWRSVHPHATPFTVTLTLESFARSGQRVRCCRAPQPQALSEGGGGGVVSAAEAEAEAETDCVILTLSTDLLVKVVSTGLSASDLCRLSCTCRRFLTICCNKCACGVGGGWKLGSSTPTSSDCLWGTII